MGYRCGCDEAGTRASQPGASAGVVQSCELHRQRDKGERETVQDRTERADGSDGERQREGNTEGGETGREVKRDRETQRDGEGRDNKRD